MKNDNLDTVKLINMAQKSITGNQLNPTRVTSNSVLQAKISSQKNKQILYLILFELVLLAIDSS